MYTCCTCTWTDEDDLTGNIWEHIMTWYCKQHCCDWSRTQITASTMGCLLWGFRRKLTTLWWHRTVLRHTPWVVVVVFVGAAVVADVAAVIAAVVPVAAIAVSVVPAVPAAAVVPAAAAAAAVVTSMPAAVLAGDEFRSEQIKNRLNGSDSTCGDFLSIYDARLWRYDGHKIVFSPQWHVLYW